MSEWDRQEGEPTIWYARFDFYRGMGPTRTLAAAYNAYRRGKDPNCRQHTNPDKGWLDNSRKWRWRERAAAWDVEQVRLAREEEARRLKKAREHMVKGGEKMQSLAAEAMKGYRATDLSPAEARAYFKDGSALILRGLGEPESVVRSEVTGAGGGPVQTVELSYEELRKLPHDELYRLYREAIAPRPEGGDEPADPPP